LQSWVGGRPLLSFSPACGPTCSRAAHRADPPAQLSLPSFLFLPAGGKWGPTVKPSPYLSPWVARPLDGRQPLPESTAPFLLQPPIKAEWSSALTPPLQSRPLPLLNPSPLIANQGQ
jgi:hypothetical protein